MAQSTEGEAVHFIREAGGIKEYRLSGNHLTVLLKEDASSPVVTVMVTYLVGSRHESDLFRGGAHLLEHMMFKGTARYQKSLGTSIPRVLQHQGAILNASTWKDGTNYYETLPNNELELALDIEADRMRGTLIKPEDLRSEMPVVQSEFDRIENSPLAALDEALWRTAFKTHAYHHPIIGRRSDLEKMTADNLRRFYDTYYWPNNAVLTVIGDFKTENVLALIFEKFKNVPASPFPVPGDLVPEPPQAEPRFTEISREDQLQAVVVAHKMPPAQNPDSTAFDVLSFILSRGKNSRLYRALVDRNLAADVASEPSKMFDEGLYATEALLTSEAGHEDVKNIILKVYRDIREQGVTQEEFQRAVNQLHAQFAYARDGSYSLAAQLSTAIAAGDWTLFSSYLDRLQKIQPEDIRRIAKDYLRDSTMTVAFLTSKTLPENSETVPDVFKNPIHEEDFQEVPPDEKTEAQDLPPQQILPGAPSSPIKLAENIHIKTFGDIKLFTLPSEVPDVVTITGSFYGGGYSFAKSSVVASLTSSLLEEGTKQHNKFQLSELLDGKGAEISFQNDYARLSFHARCLKKDTYLLFQILAEELQSPLFSEEEFEKQKEQHKVRLMQSLSDTGARAANELSRLLYPPQHPNYESPFEEQLQELKDVRVEDVREFYETHYGSQQLRFVVVGDFIQQDIEEAVRKYFKDWPAKAVRAEFPSTAGPLKHPERKLIRIPDKIKVDVLLGHTLPLTYHDPLFLPAYLANAILGGDFSARLSNIVRDDLGLTYGIYSALEGIDQQIQGHWQIGLILNQKALRDGVQATLRELQRFARAGVTPQELANEKETLSGKYKVSLSTTWGLAQTILRNDELGFELSYLDDFPNRLEAVKLEEVQEAIRRYFHPSSLHRVFSGTFDETKNSPV